MEMQKMQERETKTAKMYATNKQMSRKAWTAEAGRGLMQEFARGLNREIPGRNGQKVRQNRKRMGLVDKMNKEQAEDSQEFVQRDSVAVLGRKIAKNG